MQQDQAGTALGPELANQPPMNDSADGVGMDPIGQTYGLTAMGQGPHQQKEVGPVGGVQHRHGPAGMGRQPEFQGSDLLPLWLWPRSR